MLFRDCILPKLLGFFGHREVKVDPSTVLVIPGNPVHPFRNSHAIVAFFSVLHASFHRTKMSPPELGGIENNQRHSVNTSPIMTNPRPPVPSTDRGSTDPKSADVAAALVWIFVVLG